MLVKGRFCDGYNNIGEDGVIDIPVSDAAHLYRAGPCVICLRLPQGSAVITTASQNGKYGCGSECGQTTSCFRCLNTIIQIGIIHYI